MTDRRQPTVSVLGGGSWGTTIASITARNTPTVLWLRDEAIVTAINDTHQNPRYLPDLDLTPSIRATDDLEDAVSCADVLVMGIPSQHYRSVLEAAAPFLRPWVPIVSLVKGFEISTRKRMTEVTAEILPGHPAGVLAGPNLAREILQGYAAAATIALPDHGTAVMLQNLFHTRRFRVYTSEDVTGVETAGALKNVYAIAVGIGDGLGAGDNTRSMVITRALREMTMLGVAMGGRAETFAGLAGMGDLVATCSSPLSRNRHVGTELGRGVSIDEIIESMNQVAEGVKTVGSVMTLAEEHDVELIIASEIDAIVNRGQPAGEAYRGLLRVAPGHEVRGQGAW